MRLVRWLLLAVAVLVILVAASFVFLLSPIKGDGAARDVIITNGMTHQEAAKLLSDDQLIRSRFAFYLYEKLTRKTVLPGTYSIAPTDSGSRIAEILNAGDFKVTKITIPEGWRATDIEDYLVNEKGLSQFKGFADTANADEGYLFPDTYEIKVDETTLELIKLMRDNFTTRTAGLAVKPETVILASIVEREAKDDTDRPAIAAVYINRLKIGMKLEADPTVQYAKGNWKPVTLAEYQSVVSPYNTYLHDGLPPGPICNPGLASIKAVLNPNQSDYLYFFHAQGQTYFSKTLAEHEAKIRMYL